MDSSTCAVLHAGGASMQSLIGPGRSAKMCVSDGEGEGVEKGLITTDSMQVLTMLTDRIEHPSGHLIHSAALSHHSNHGCGVTSLVCLAAVWSREIANLTRQDMPLPLVFAVFDECLSQCGTVLDSLSISLTRLREDWSSSCSSAMATGRKPMMSYSRYSRRGTSSVREGGNMSKEFLKHIGSQLCHGRELAMQLAIEAVHPQLKKMSSLDMSKVMSLPVVGVASDHSRVVMGVACRLREDMVHIVHENKNTTLRTMVLCGDVVEMYAHKGLHSDVPISSVIQSCDIKVKSHDPWLQTWQDFLTEHAIGLLVVQGAVSPSLYDHCLARGIVVITQLPATHVWALCHVSEARAVNYIAQITDECDVGMVRLGMVEGGWTKRLIKHASRRGVIGGETATYYCCVEPVLSERQCNVTTVILCGHTHSQTNMLKHSLYNCLSRLRCVLCDECAVRGGGWVEGKVAGVLRGMDINPGSIPYCIRTGWLGQYLNSSSNAVIVNGFANGLENFAALVLRSLEPAYGVCGGHYQALTQVKTLQNENSSVVGVATCPVLDPSSCKLASWRTVFHLVRTLTSCTQQTIPNIA